MSESSEPMTSSPEFNPTSLSIGDVVCSVIGDGERRDVVVGIGELGEGGVVQSFEACGISVDEEGNETLGMVGGESPSQKKKVPEEPWSIDRIMTAMCRYWEVDEESSQAMQKFRQELERYQASGPVKLPQQ